jgi:GNAT superfamily N-acetyltransferase/predicted nucleic acid-binding protein
MEILIKREFDEVYPHLQAVMDRGDADPGALGFLPGVAYEEAARQGKLLVAVARSDGPEMFAGHLLYGGAFPHLRVFQVFAEPSYRRIRVASRLVDFLVREAEESSYLTISARVAEDLGDANKFWEHKGFDLVKVIRGGPSRARMINVRVRHLNTPTLFDTRPLAVAPTQDLRLTDRVTPTSPTYSLDVNVLLDLAEGRPRRADVRRIIGAAMNSVLRLFVAQEFIRELERSRVPGQRDPVLEFARGLPQFPPVPGEAAERLFLELSMLVFPERARRGELRDRDRSDLLHLITAIHHKANGFVTSEQGILRRRAALRANYGIDVIGVTELAELVAPDSCPPNADLAAAAPDRDIRISQLDEAHRAGVEEFLNAMGVSDAASRDAVSPGPVESPRRRYCVVCDRMQVGFAAWDSPRSIREVDVEIFVDDTHPAAGSTADYLLDVAIRDACQRGPSVLRLVSSPVCTSVLAVAMARGFRRPQGDPEEVGPSVLKKVCIGQVVGPATLPFVRCEIQRLAQVGLPAELPPYTGPGTLLRVTTPRAGGALVTLDQMESLLGPTLFLLPGRSCALVPVRPEYAAELLESRSQRKMFPRMEASLFSERVYYSSQRTASVLQPGTLLLFYESSQSGKPGAVIACARVIRAALAFRPDISEETRRRGVLSPAQIDKLGRCGPKNLTYFDNMMRFRKPVQVRRLRQVGCKGTLVTSKRVSAECFRRVVEEGEPCALL